MVEKNDLGLSELCSAFINLMNL